ncbi:MAG: hypothetical protein JWQ04_2441 [Pedosphaera sp.]|nr:hypothetical protein [Pedosphaera sp.]
MTYAFLLLRQRPIQFALVKKALFRFHGTGVDDPHLLPVRPINTEYSGPVGGHAQVEKPGLNRKPGCVRQQSHRKRIFKRFLNLLSRQRTVQIEGRVIPIKLHMKLIAFKTPTQCNYNVFTWRGLACQMKNQHFFKKSAFRAWTIPIETASERKFWQCLSLGGTGNLPVPPGYQPGGRGGSSGLQASV